MGASRPRFPKTRTVRKRDIIRTPKPLNCNNYCKVVKINEQFLQKIRTLAIGGSYEQENKSPDRGTVQGDYSDTERGLLRLPPQRAHSNRPCVGSELRSACQRYIETAALRYCPGRRPLPFGNRGAENREAQNLHRAAPDSAVY